MNTQDIASKLAELKFGKKQELSSDKVGYKVEDALALESTLNSIKSALNKHLKMSYQKSGVMQKLESMDDRVETRRSDEVLNDVTNTANEILSLINKL